MSAGYSRHLSVTGVTHPVTPGSRLPSNGNVIRLHSPSGPYVTAQIGHLDEHLNWMARNGRAESTIKARRMVLTWLAEFLGHDPATATATELDQWQASLRTLNSVRWQTAMIRPYYAYLQARGIRPDNPALLLPKPRQRRRLPKPIPDDRLFAAVVEAPPRILPWLLLAGWSGLRASDIAGLRREDFTVTGEGDERQVWVRMIGKGDVEREVAVPVWVWDTISPLLPESGPCWRRAYKPHDRPVTAKHITDAVAYYFGKVRGIPDRLHSLRHRVATAVLEQTHDLRLVQEILGHSNLQTLQVYTLVQSKRMTRAVEQLPRPDRLDERRAS